MRSVRLFIIISKPINVFYTLIKDPGVAGARVKEATDLLRRVPEVNVCHVGHVMVVEHLDAITFVRPSYTTVPKLLARQLQVVVVVLLVTSLDKPVLLEPILRFLNLLPLPGPPTKN